MKHSMIIMVIPVNIVQASISRIFSIDLHNSSLEQAVYHVNITPCTINRESSTDIVIDKYIGIMTIIYCS